MKQKYIREVEKKVDAGGEECVGGKNQKKWEKSRKEGREELEFEVEREGEEVDEVEVEVEEERDLLNYYYGVTNTFLSNGSISVKCSSVKCLR